VVDVNAEGLSPTLRLWVARNLMVDRVTAEVSGALAAAGVESLVLKGPVLAEWLYPGEVRPYGDSDLLISPGDWRAALEVLERLGFHEFVHPTTHPPIESNAATEFLRGEQNVDLHRTLHGLEGSPTLVASTLMAGAGRQVIGGAELRVAGRVALLLNVGLHAAHHFGEDKPVEDLRRAIQQADERLWWEALGQARAFDGVPAFASGLRRLPEGVELARRLGIEDVRATRYELRRQHIQTAEGIDVLLSTKLAHGERLAIIAREFFPAPRFMRSWTPLARRGWLGLAGAYVWRAIWLLLHAPRAIVARWRVRRANSNR
jgi:hypothetical protein